MSPIEANPPGGRHRPRGRHRVRALRDRGLRDGHPNAQARGASEVAALLQQNLEQEKHALEVARTTMNTIAGQGIAVTVAA